jgi:hypothetical protein
MLVTQLHWKKLEDQFREFCLNNALSEKNISELLSIAIITEVNEKERIIPNTDVLSIRQYFDDGSSEIFSIGDDTTDGKILEIKTSGDAFPYVLTDSPSEWQLQNGCKNGWSWTWLLKKK